jgi:nitrate reductase cytochrome c-type subunit
VSSVSTGLVHDARQILVYNQTAQATSNSRWQLALTVPASALNEGERRTIHYYRQPPMRHNTVDQQLSASKQCDSIHQENG